MSDLADLFKELEQVAKDTNLKEVKNKPLEESVASKDDVSSLFEGLEAAYTETRIEEEIANRLSEEDEQKLGAFSGFMESVTELTNQPNPQKAIEDLFATVAPPQPPVETLDEPVVIEKIVEEPIEVEQADTIIQQIVSSLDDMGEKTEVKEQVDQISKLRDEFNNFRALMQQQVLSHTPGSGEVRLEFLDDVQSSTAKVDDKFLKYSSSDGKWIGADASGGGSSAADDISAGDAAVTITTTSGDITIDAAANNSDIILKGTDGSVDTTFVTVDGSAAGKSTFNDEIVSGAVITSGAGLVIADDGNIGSASDTDAIAIASDGVVTMDQIPVFSAGINVSGGTIAGTLATVAQGNITSLGTLTAVTVDDVAINGKVITMTGSSSDTAVFTAGTNGTLSIVTTDDAAAAANIQITADGTVDIDSAGILTLDSGAAINIEPASGSAILLDGTISVDAGVVTGATSITSTAFVGDLTGDVTGNTSGTAATVTTAAQTNITSLGTLTALTVDDVAVNGKVITMTGSSSDTAVFTAGTHGTLSIVTTDDAAAAANIQITADGTVDIDSAGVLTLDSGAAINIEPASGSAILLDGTISVDAGVVTGATSITSTAFVGDITGDVTGNTSGTAATVTTAAQTNITSLGTLTALTVDDVVINGKVMTMTGSTDDTAVFTVGTHGTLSIVTTDDAAAAANITITADGTFEADGTTITLDSAGDIVLDAAGNNVTFKSAGTAILDISNSSSDAVITSSVQDKDIIFKGDDGGAAITALTLDMSEAGDATFNNDIYVDKIRRASDSGTTTKILLNDEVLKLYAGHSSKEVVNIASGEVIVGHDAADANVAPTITLNRTSNNPADNDLGGVLNFEMENDNDQQFSAGQIVAKALDVSDGTEDGELRLSTITNGSLVLGATIRSNGIIIPDAGIIGSASDTDAIAISSAGVVALSATTEASAIGTAALTLAGGIGVAKDMWIGDDIVMDSDAAVIKLGADQDVTITHNADKGITLNDMDISGVTSINGTDSGSGAAYGQIGGRRNFVYNGDMQVCQRATSATTIGDGNTGLHVQDRWKFYEAGSPAAEVTWSKSSTAPDGFHSSLKMIATTNSGTVGADDHFTLSQLFEGQDLQGWNKGDANARSVTLSFWVNATQTGTYCVNLIDADNSSRQISKSYTIDSADTWEYKTLTYEGDTTGAFDNDTALSLYVYWGLVEGTNYTSGTLGTSWAAYDATTRFEPCDAFDDDGDMFHITGVQMELGDTATAFEYESYQENLLRCQRYYTKRAASNAILYGSSVSGSGFNYSHWQFHVPMRAAPTMTGNTGTQQQISVDSGGVYNTAGSYASWGNGSTAESEL